MKGWAIGIVFFYVALGVFNWVTGLHWLADFSLPLSIVGGIGLAIASNSPPPTLPSHPAPQPKTDTSSPDTSSPIADATANSTDTDTSPSDTSPTKETSISFTINKTLRP